MGSCSGAEGGDVVCAAEASAQQPAATKSVLPSLFLRYSRTIRDGDTAIVFVRHNEITPLRITAGQYLVNSCGRFKHDDFIGRPWGTRFLPHGSKHAGSRETAKTTTTTTPAQSSLSAPGVPPPTIVLLHPTPELWAIAVPHRTQIVYQADACLITALLRLRPGAIVVEAGAGSGALTHALARTVAPHGTVHTFEYHAGRHEMACREFEEHGLMPAGVVTCTLRDVCGDGFPQELRGAVDAVFLDLPAPWDAVHHAAAVLRRDTISRVCCFSPCIEQVQRTCVALRAAGFLDIQLHELLLREEEVRRTLPRPIDLARCRSRRSESQLAATLPDATAHFHGRPVTATRGHTSFLTFASLVPCAPCEASSLDDGAVCGVAEKLNAYDACNDATSNGCNGNFAEVPVATDDAGSSHQLAPTERELELSPC